MPQSIPAPPPIDGAPNVGSSRTLGSGANQACAGNDVRLPPNLVDIAGAVPVEDGLGAVANRRLTLDDINAAYTITSFAFNSVTNPVEIGVTVSNPAFTASYNRPAGFATINDGSGPHTITLPATSFAFNAGGIPAASYSNNTINASQSFTLSANETGGPVKTAGLSIAWQPRLYYGVSTDPGTYNQAFITGLASNFLGANRTQTQSFNSGASQYMWFAFPTAYGGSPSNFIDNSTGFAAGFSQVGTVSVTAATAGAPVNNYAVWRSDVANLGAQTIRVT